MTGAVMISFLLLLLVGYWIVTHPKVETASPADEVAPVSSSTAQLVQPKPVAPKQATPVAKNYFPEVLDRVNQHIVMRESWGIWLQGAETQFMTLNILLSSFSTRESPNDLFNKDRDSITSLVSAEMSVINRLQEDNEKQAAAWESTKGFLLADYDGEKFLGKANLDAVVSPELVKEDLDSVQAKILDVMTNAADSTRQLNNYEFYLKTGQWPVTN